MKKELPQESNTNLPQTQSLSEVELFNVLKSSLYLGAQDESIKLVLGYCQAAGLDPMQKPVHIVPMYCATGKKDSKGYDVKAMRDVIMPGIGMYRIQASRSGEYAGASEPEYGDDVTEDLSGINTTYPKWCKITVKRMLSNGSIAEFSAIEFWKENYATKGRDSVSPNAMWGKRPYGQIAKCAEAQALRKAFPEFGSAPTVDEMEGKEIDVTPTSSKEELPIEYITVDQATCLNDLCAEVKGDMEKFCVYAAIDSIELLPADKFSQAVDALESKRK
tara:strand:+ start:2644 stop:3471 length:828 start_codon:yes stop_codon:yes gene_type:complete